jgi:hypothetical protein
VHTVLRQSEARLQTLPAAQALQAPPPPQSMSVSVPFLTPSVQVAAWHVLVVVPEHTLLLQSVPVTQILVLSQGEQLPPPQSVSVSVPFLVPSLQLLAWQKPPVHTAVWQSVFTEQCLPAAQSAAQLPPQSTSVSLEF